MIKKMMIKKMMMMIISAAKVVVVVVDEFCGFFSYVVSIHTFLTATTTLVL